MQKRNKIPLFWPFIPKKQILKEIANTLDGRWLGQGPKVDLFEQKIGEKWGYKYPLFMNSGTSALEMAYHLIGLKEGDEVIVPVLNCTAGQTGLLRRGVKIVFADVDDNLNIDPEDVVRKTTDKTKAIVGVHLGGIHFNKSLYKIAKDLNIPLIVDSAQYHAPTKGDYICYSFQAIKHITTCDGGMLVLNNKDEYVRAKKLRWFGIDRELKTKHNYQAWERRQMTFDIEEAGYKMQPTDIDACFGLASLPFLDGVIEHRRKLVIEYLLGLEGVDEVEVVAGGTFWLMGIIAEKRDELADFLTKNGIENNLIHLRNDIFKILGPRRSNLPNMDRLEPKYLYLPLNPKVTKSDVKYICKKIKEFYER
jgi:perosamine synthetase